MLRRLQAQHIHTIKRVNFDRFHDEQYRVRRDFDKVYRNPEATDEEYEALFAKYEHHIMENFEPYAAMHESRPHSNLWGKMVLWGDECLKSDHIGFYNKNVLLHAEPTSGHFHEEYPHQVQAWAYDEHYLNAEFDYDKEESLGDATSAEDLKKTLDSAR